MPQQITPWMPGEGRDGDACRALTARLLFPGGARRPGAWILALASACAVVALRACESLASR